MKHTASIAGQHLLFRKSFAVLSIINLYMFVADLRLWDCTNPHFNQRAVYVPVSLCAEIVLHFGRQNQKTVRTQRQAAPAFFHWDISVIYPVIVLKAGVTVATGLPFQTLWPKWLKFFSVM